MNDLAACTAELDRYLGGARSTAQQMTALSTSMDDCMGSMGRLSSADMHDTCLQMNDELDLAMDRGEADRHCAQMQSLIQVQLQRADSMMQGGGGMAGTLSGGTCHR